ncbi:MAG: EAL domain-containing protein [Pseudomonadaceae bacterium]|nr:EAL domain-containing protein [Pseudomonadaceae bacterium]
MNRVLIVTSQSNDAKALSEVLQDASDGPYAIESLTLLAPALARIDSGDIDVILVDLSLPDSQGIATFDQLFAVAPQIPILILSGTEEEELANLAVQRGAQGYLSKGYFESYLVPQSLRNIIQRKAVEESVFMEKARAEITLNSISDAVIGTDMNGNVDYLNVAAEKMTGWPREDARGKPISVVMQIINGATREPRRNPIELVLEQDQEMQLTAGTILIRRDGRECAIEDSAAPIHDANGQLSGAVIVFHDITDAQATALKMAYLAQHDFLTNLPNRVLLNDRISQAIAVAERRRSHLGVLFLDLDNFKLINDSLGHSIGDRLLQSVAQRLTACVRRSDTVSRQGGDEFVVLLTEDNFAEDAALTAEKILTAMAQSHVLDGQQLLVTTSIGISTYPADGLNAETLIKHADSAMYQAKERGRNNYQFFASNMSNQAVARQTIETELRVALERHEFVLHYQPKVNLASGAITGTEALLRWNHLQLGQLQPSRFVSIAEDCGLIVEIGRWVLHEACKQACLWRDSELLCGPMAVNVSALEFRDKGFVAGLEAILAQTGLPASALQLELSESALMREAQFSSQVLQQLHSLGVLLAVDEFGTGYSSLTQLAQFPLDVLKIDQSFVQKLDAQDDNRVIVSALIAMGSSLKLRLVAEGVENPAQLAFLKGQRCEEGQGFLFSPPLAAERMSALLVRGIRPLTFSGRE